jgi:colicin import membrane protein
MRELVRAEIDAAADAMDLELTQALTLKSDPAEGLPEAYDVTAAKIAELAQSYMPLTIAGVADKAGYLQVHEARMEVKALRIAVEKKRLELNKDSQDYIKAVNAYAKKITADLTPIEDHLEAQEKAVDAEIARAKAEAQRIVDERNQGRLDALIAVGAQISLAQVVLMDDSTFQSYLALATKSHEDAQRKAAEEAAAAEAQAKAEAAKRAQQEQEEADRLAKIKAEQAAEAARLEAVRVEQAKQAAELKAAQDQIDAGRRALEQAQAVELARKDLEAKIKAESERVQREAAEKAEREAAAAKLRAEAEAARLAAIEAAKPDAEKLEGFAYFLEGKAPPDMETQAGKQARIEIIQAGRNLISLIRSKAQALTK